VALSALPLNLQLPSGLKARLDAKIDGMGEDLDEGLGSAEREGLRLDNMQRARQFARSYSEKELDELCWLRTPGGMPLGWGHVRRLVSLPNKAKRSALQRRTPSMIEA